MGARKRDNLSYQLYHAFRDDHRSPHRIPLDGITVFCSRNEGYSISSFTQIPEDLATDLELGLVLCCIPVCRTLDETELCAISSMRSVYIEWQGNYMSAGHRMWNKPRLTLQELVFLVPIYLSVYPYG